MKKILTLSVLAVAAIPMMAQQNLLEGATISTLGAPLTWSNGDNSYTFVTDDLPKLLDPTNTSNVFLYPENGAINTEDNQAKGAQVFYITLDKEESIGSIITTWEGAAADSYNIYVTSTQPTEAILETTPTYQATNLGQYTENTAMMPENTKGKYIVFQVTKATNWGWGVKMRTIVAYSPMDDELTTFTVSPKIIAFGEETEMTVKCLNQLGETIQDGVVITVSDNATYTDGKLTINTGEKATFTATFGETEMTQTVYAATAPTTPDVETIATPIYTNGDSEDNSSVEFVTAWNGGAVSNGEITFENGAVASSFSNTQCVFFTNKETTGEWNGMTINPLEEGYKTLNLDVFSASNASGQINLSDGKFTLDITLTEGEWTSIVMNLEDFEYSEEDLIKTMSIRFDAANTCDILIANIYFGNGKTSGVKFDTIPESSSVDVINLQGVVVKRNVNASEALSNLPKGIYIVGGKKIVK